MSRVTRVLSEGEQVSKPSLQGNALQVNGGWLDITSGIDTLPIFNNNVNSAYSLVVNCYPILAPLNRWCGQGFDVNNAWAIRYGDRFGWQPGMNDINEVTGPIAGFNKRVLLIATHNNFNVVNNTIPDLRRNFINGKFTPPNVVNNGVPISYNQPFRINSNGPSSVGCNFYYRSFEIIYRMLTTEEIRTIYNVGTAAAAGIFDAEPFTHMGIDFNRQPGELPINYQNALRLNITVRDSSGTSITPTAYVNYLTL